MVLLGTTQEITALLFVDCTENLHWEQVALLRERYNTIFLVEAMNGLPGPNVAFLYSDL